MAKKIAGETVLNELPSREGVVYITNKYAYKVFGNRTNPYEVVNMYKDAEAKGVPVTDTAKFTADLQDGNKTETISGIRSIIATGRFFQLGKAGGESVLINEINQMHNRELLKVVIVGLENAAKAGLSDPQGFFSANSNPPLIFIDLHIGGTGLAFSNAINAAKLKLEQLG